MTSLARKRRHHVALTRALFIDDDPETRRLFSLLSRVYGLPADVAGSAVEAIGLALHRSYCAVISDLQMPNLDGRATLDKLAALLPDAALFVLTGVHPLPAVTLRCGRTVTVMAKPWKNDELFASIARAVEQGREVEPATRSRVDDASRGAILTRLKQTSARPSRIAVVTDDDEENR